MGHSNVMREGQQMSLPRSIKVVVVATALVGALALGCSSGDDGATEAEAPADNGAGADADAAVVEEYALVQQFDLSINVTSSKFNEERRIPRKYGCTEEDVSAPITWSEVPEGTVSLALVVDSDQFPGTPWVHWVLSGIPPDARGLPEAVPNTAEAPSIGPKARQGTNSDEKVGWLGPCPPPIRVLWGGDRGAQELAVKHYWFRLYALDTEIDLGPEATKWDLLRAIDGHILAGGELVGEHVSQEKITAPR